MIAHSQHSTSQFLNFLPDYSQVMEDWVISWNVEAAPDGSLTYHIPPSHLHDKHILQDLEREFRECLHDRKHHISYELNNQMTEIWMNLLDHLIDIQDREAEEDEEENDE